MPEPMVVCKVMLKLKRTLEDIGRGRRQFESVVELPPEKIVLRPGSSRVKLFELSHRANVQRIGKLAKLRAHDGIT